MRMIHTETWWLSVLSLQMSTLTLGLSLVTHELFRRSWTLRKGGFVITCHLQLSASVPTAWESAGNTLLRWCGSDTAILFLSSDCSEEEPISWQKPLFTGDVSLCDGNATLGPLSGVWDQPWALSFGLIRYLFAVSFKWKISFHDNVASAKCKKWIILEKKTM